jgi:integrase
MQRDLTDALIRTLRAPGGGRLELWDRRCEGLVLRVANTGRVTFHARARGPDGRKRFAALGAWPTLSLADARTGARLAIGMIQRGGDPTAEKRAVRAERERADLMPTLRELGQSWARAHARDTSARYRAEVLATVNRACGPASTNGRSQSKRPDLLTRRIDTIAVDEITIVIQATRLRGDGEARHLVRALRRLFGFACAAGQIQHNPVDAWLRREKGARRSIPWMRDGMRERVLSDDELRRLWIATEALDPSAQVFARLMLLTACRTGEIAGLTWREVEAANDRAARRLVALQLPPHRTKNGRPHRVPLSKLAAEALAAFALNKVPAPAGLVFPGLVSRTASICRSLRKATGITDWSWHDCRRTAATGMARLGCPREHVEAALNHISARGGLIGIYQRHAFETEAAQALLRWQVYLAALVTGEHSPRAAVNDGTAHYGFIPQ